MLVSLAKKSVPFLVAALLGGVATQWLGGSAAPEAPPPSAVAAVAAAAPAVPQLATVSAVSSAARLRLGGYVEVRSLVRLAAQQPGRVAYVAGQEGDRMQAGQLVVALDDDAIRPEYRAAWAALAAQMSASQNAQTQLYHNIYGRPTSPMGGPAYDAYDKMSVPFYNMAQSIFGAIMPGLGAGSGSPFGSFGPMMSQSQSQRSWPAINNARAEYERSLSGLVESQTRIDSLDAQFRTRQSIAPADSVIVRKYVRAGDVVQPGQPLVDVADTRQLQFHLEVPVTLMTNIRTGDQVPLSVNGQNIWATVEQINPTADQAQRTVTVKLAVPEGAPLAPGMYGVAWLPQPGGGSPSETSPAIPEAAITYRGSLPMAFVASASGAAEMRILRLGDKQDGMVTVLSGLSIGEQVMLNPPPGLRAGQASEAAP